jgi:hypothetical protein
MMTKLLSRSRKKNLRAVSEVDPELRQEIEQLFSPPVLWAFRKQSTIQQRFAEIISDSARRAIADQPTSPKAITAAVSRLSMDGASWRSYRFGDRAWQADAWRLYDITGQLRFVSNWVGNSVSRCELYVAEVGPDGNPGKRVDDNDTVSALAAGPLGSGDTKAEALRLLGIDLFVPGEAYIVAESGAADDGSDLWWVVTARQIRRQGDRITVARSPLYGGGVMEYREGVDLILRVWTPHPADTEQPDSPTRSAIPDLREMEALRKREFAELDSRLSGAGLFAIPDSLELPRGDDDPPGAAGFSALLGRIMSRSLRDRSSAEAMVPIIITGPGDDIEKIRHITLWSELSAQIGDMREGALRSLAQSLDIPPEVLLGLGGTTNHWNAWAISREAVQVHIKPILTRIAAALTTGYLAPALEALGLDPSAYMYVFDTAPLTTNPDRSGDALNLHDRMLISDEATRTASAWGADDAPSREERAVRIVEKLLFAKPDAVLADPALRALIGLPVLEVPAAPAVEAEPTPVEVTGPAPVEETEGPPVEETVPPSPTTGPMMSFQFGGGEVSPGLSFAAQLAVRRALALAGTRLVPHSRRPAGVPRHQLHVCHGPVDGRRKAEFLDGSWRDEFEGVGVTFGVDDQVFLGIVEEHCRDLLTRGIAYDPADVDALFASPATRIRLMAPGVVAAVRHG